MDIFDPIVSGANRLAHFNVRCPACNKLFRIDSKEIVSSNPQFECSSCSTEFCFDYPPQDLNRIETRIKTAAPLQKMEEAATEAINDHLKACPKCQSLNPLLNQDCVKCGVIFEKIENLPQDPHLKAFPSLARAWQELLEDYNNIKKHVAFVDRAEDLEAIPFALKKYQILKEAQPHDKVAQEMLTQVLLRSISRQANKISGMQAFREALTKVNWHRVRKLAPLVTGSLLIVYGLSHAGARNLVGIGAAILFLTIGMTVFLKGRVQLSDFWD